MVFQLLRPHRVKETSINPMKNNFKRTFGFYIGSKKIRDIKPMDVQQALNTMEKRRYFQQRYEGGAGQTKRVHGFCFRKSNDLSEPVPDC